MFLKAIIHRRVVKKEPKPQLHRSNWKRIIGKAFKNHQNQLFPKQWFITLSE